MHQPGDRRPRLQPRVDVGLRELACGACENRHEREQYLALERSNHRYDIGLRYGLLHAQMALALSGRDRDEVLSQLVELLAMREMAAVVNEWIASPFKLAQAARELKQLRQEIGQPGATGRTAERILAQLPALERAQAA